MLSTQMHTYFKDAGMPSRPDLSAVIFEDTRSPLPATTFERDPRLAKFMPWFMEHGRTTYNSYLLSHPGYALIEPARHMTTIIDAAGLTTYHDRRYRPALPTGLNKLVYPGNGEAVALWAGLALVLGLLAVPARLLDRRALIALSLLASVIPIEIIVWDGEPSEIPRHALMASVSARLGLLLLLAVSLDAATTRVRRSGHGR
jgi:hypothetical protein